jgi:hypothetical protein
VVCPLQKSLESNVAGHESEALVEAVGVRALEIGRELNPIAPCFTGGIDSHIQKLLPEAPPTEIRMDVHGLHLSTTAPVSLEVPKHHQLAHPHDVAIQFHNQNITPVGRLDLGERCPIDAQVGSVLLLIVQRTVTEEFDEALYVP